MEEKIIEEFCVPETTTVNREYLGKLEEGFLYYKKALQMIEEQLDNDPNLAIEEIEEIIREVKELV